MAGVGRSNPVEDPQINPKTDSSREREFFRGEITMAKDAVGSMTDPSSLHIAEAWPQTVRESISRVS